MGGHFLYVLGGLLKAAASCSSVSNSKPGLKGSTLKCLFEVEVLVVFS